jgi:cadmium resistance protein CadD (predicted permease)
MNQKSQTYLFQFVGITVLYAAVLFLTVWLLGALGDSPWRLVVTLLPLIPIGLALLVFMGQFGQMDELQQRIQLQALAFSFFTSGMLTFSYGLLQNVGLPQVSFIAVFPLMIALWGLGYVIAARRYR